MTEHENDVSNNPREGDTAAPDANNRAWDGESNDLSENRIDGQLEEADKTRRGFETAARLCVMLLLALTVVSAGLEYMYPQKQNLTYAECAAVAADQARLACYDKVTVETAGPAKGGILPHAK
jgi:hypothetical protein